MLCSLPGGLVDDGGEVHDEVDVRALSGREEERLLAVGTAGVAPLVTDLLSRCLLRIGGTEPVDAATARRLVVGDRQFALLKIREATFGELVQGTVPCPWPDCGERVGVSFSTHDVPIEPSVDKGPCYTVTLSRDAMPEADEADRIVTFRVPNGADQEAVSPLLAGNEAAALTGLLARCVLGLGHHHEPASGEDVARLSPLARQEIEGHMERVAPHVDLLMDLACVACGRGFSAPFDLQTFFFGELRLAADALYREVHYLAYHYHWSEQEIMEMDHGRRRRYIDLLADEIERINASA